MDEVEELIERLRDEGSLRSETMKANKTPDSAYDARTLELQVQALTDEKEYVRMLAAEALGKTGGTRAVEPLFKAFTDLDTGVRMAAGKALGRIGDARAIEPLLKALRDPSTGVRMAAAKALGKLGRREAIPGLRARLRHVVGEGNHDVRSSVRAALDSIEKATAGIVGLPRAVEPEIPSTYKRPRAVEDAGNR